MKTYTASQVARFTKRAPSTIGRLCATGKLKAERVAGAGLAGKRTWVISIHSDDKDRTDKEVLIDTVRKLVPKGGYTKKVAPKATTPQKATPLALSQVIRFMALSESAREMLLTIGEKANEVTLEVLVGLV